MDMPSFDLSGKTALITGASRGIGLAIARTYALAGADVVLSSRKQEALNQAAQEIKADGGNAFPLAAHTGKPEQISNLVSETIQKFSGIDILVNNAGTNPHFGPILSAEESHWNKILDVNLKGYFRMVKSCVDSMRAQDGGKIINIASISGIVPEPGLGVYSVSKAGVLMLTKVLASELADDNIQVNAIAPGFIKTSFSQILWDTPKLKQAIIDNIPVGRIGIPQDISGIALYLASKASSFTTGATFTIDGGQLVGNKII